MEPGQKVWRAHTNPGGITEQDGMPVFCSYGYVSECGGWVDQAGTRHRLTPEWFDNEEAAVRSKAAQVATYGARLLRQANDLLRRVPEAAAS